MIARIAAVAMAVCLASPALAQTKPVCGNYVEVTAFLKEKFDQEAVAHGIDRSGNAAQVLVSPGGGDVDNHRQHPGRADLSCRYGQGLAAVQTQSPGV